MSRSLSWVLVVGFALGTLGCGSSSSQAGGDAAVDAPIGPGDGPGGADGPGGTDGPGETDGSALDDGSVSPDGAACPAYQALCNGSCIPVSVDPDNCGGCGVVCDADQACAGGQCATSCLPGATICDRRCVDVETDNLHCGGCGQPCDVGEGCVEGNCETAVVIGPPPTCPPGGVVVSEGGDGGVSTCAGTLAQTTFRWALCSCTDVVVSQTLFTDGYDSSAGPYEPGGLGGGVGLDGTFSSSSGVEVWGALWGSAADGLTTSHDVAVKQELHLGGPMRTSQPFAVGADAWVNGDITASAAVTVAGTLYVPDTATLSANLSYGALVTGPVSVPPPCDCATDQIIPVADIVAAYQTDNDNAAVGLDPAVLVSPGAATRLDLPCGRYYLDAITGASDATIAVHGRTLIFIGGNVQVSGALRFTLDPTAEMDVFIAGSFTSSRPFAIGSPNYPALTRFYIQGEVGQDAFRISSNSLMGAFFYAAAGPVRASSSLEVFGGIFAGHFQNSAPTAIHYDRAALAVGDECAPPATVDGGVPPAGCGSCLDCGNQACIDGACGDCTDSSQCCAPLICWNGTCVPVPE